MNEVEVMVLKWGIVSVGKISNNFAQAISITPPSEHKITAVAARNEKRACDFATLYNIPTAYGNYESLAEDQNVDIVYIGSIHPQHFPISKLMLEHGKHVLCEKPLTMNGKQTEELVALAQNKKLFLMEAMWSRCFPVYDKLKELIDCDIIGEILHVAATFGSKLDHVPRLNLRELGGGTILDLGVYALQFQQFVFHGMKPLKIVSGGHLNEYGTDESASMIITYDGGRTAIISCHARVVLPNEAVIVGTKGTIRVPTYWCPTEIITPTEILKFDLPKTTFSISRPAGLSYEIMEVGRCIKKGLLESPKIRHEESIQLAKLMDEFRKGVGVVYEEDLTSK